jgi:hypothetical protein
MRENERRENVSRYTYQRLPEMTPDEARRMPTFYRVVRVSRPDYSCEDCQEHAREPWLDGSGCDAHKVEEIHFTRETPTHYRAALLALEVLRTGGNPEPRYPEGSTGAAQYGYRRPARKADRESLVLALTQNPTAAVAA